jgi:hypothetical protein
MAGISVSKSPPERRNPAGKAGFGSGLQAALVHNGLYLFSSTFGERLGSRSPTNSFLPTVYVKLNITAYITNAKFSNSCCNTGSEHPDISTRPTASRAACGETP